MDAEILREKYKRITGTIHHVIEGNIVLYRA